MIYLDNAATTPLSKHVRSLLLERYDRLYGNNSSPHHSGIEANQALENARTNIANLLKVDSRGIYFTSGATESINLLFQGYAKFLQKNRSTRNEIIISQIEHPAVYQNARYLNTQGFIIHELRNNKYGQVDLDDLQKKLNDRTALVAIMAVNNETGIIQNIKEISSIVKNHNENILFFTDTVQALGKIQVNQFTGTVDALCGSGHKVGGPKGVGFLYLNTKFRLLPLMYGGDQELSYRPGTVNVPSIDLMTEAFQDRLMHYNTNTIHVEKINKYLDKKLHHHEIKYRRIVPYELASPYIFCMSLPINNDSLIELLTKKNICVSKRSACSSQSHTKSRILESMDINDEEIDRIIRVSFSPETTEREIDIFVEALSQVIR